MCRLCKAAMQAQTNPLTLGGVNVELTTLGQDFRYDVSTYSLFPRSIQGCLLSFRLILSYGIQSSTVRKMWDQFTSAQFPRLTSFGILQPTERDLQCLATSVRAGRLPSLSRLILREPVVQRQA